MNSFATEKQLEQARKEFKYIGKNVLLSHYARYYNRKNISIGDNSRVDDFAILSAGEGGIEIGRYVHIACHCTLQGQGKITMKDFSGISSRVAIYSSSDSYDGEFMTNPCVPEFVRNTKHKDVNLGKHVVIGTGSTLLPGVDLEDGCAIGAMGLVLPGYYQYNSILIGSPARFYKYRNPKIYDFEKLIKNDND